MSKRWCRSITAPDVALSGNSVLLSIVQLVLRIMLPSLLVLLDQSVLLNIISLVLGIVLGSLLITLIHLLVVSRWSLLILHLLLSLVVKVAIWSIHILPLHLDEIDHRG